MKTKLTLISTVVIALLMASAGAAFAQDDSSTSPPEAPGVNQNFQGPRGEGQGGPRRPAVRRAIRLQLGELIDLAEDYTGLSAAEIRAAHQNGQTLAELIDANGQSVDAFIAAAVADMNARIDTAVENGNLDAERAETLKANIETRVTTFVNEGPGANDGPGPIRNAFRMQLRELVNLAEDYTGLSAADIREALQGGQTLADLIDANSQSVDAFVTAAVADINARIDTAVENGNLDAERAETLKGNIAERVTTFVNEGPGANNGPGPMPPITDEAV